MIQIIFKITNVLKNNKYLNDNNSIQNNNYIVDNNSIQNNYWYSK